MGTFHHDKGELHGITVVVDTSGPEIFVGRCDTQDDASIVLLDVDFHEDGAEGKSKQDWLDRVAMVGPWAKHPRVVLPMEKVASVKKLAEL